MAQGFSDHSGHEFSDGTVGPAAGPRAWWVSRRPLGCDPRMARGFTADGTGFHCRHGPGPRTVSKPSVPRR